MALEGSSDYHGPTCGRGTPNSYLSEVLPILHGAQIRMEKLGASMSAFTFGPARRRRNRWIKDDG